MVHARKSILIADDDPRLAAILALHLRNEYYSVSDVFDAEAALRRLSSDSTPDLLILSPSLPGAGDGGAIECRRQCERRSIPVVYLAAERPNRREQRFLDELDAGAPLLRRPVATADLLELVSSTLRRRVAAA